MQLHNSLLTVLEKLYFDLISQMINVIRIFKIFHIKLVLIYHQATLKLLDSSSRWFLCPNTYISITTQTRFSENLN